MSTRVKRTSKTTVTSQSSTASDDSGAGMSVSSPRGRVRPPSPTMITRREEKFELSGLNDRLAAYIDKVRSLELENARLTKITETIEETQHREVTNIKALYENELAASKSLLDETAKEKAKLQVENGKYLSELNDYKEKYNSRDADYKRVEKRVYTAESQVNDLQARLNDSINQRKRWEDDYNKLKKEYDALVKALATAKKQLEDETVARVDLENRLQSLKEELSFKNAVHAQEMNETVQRSRVEVEEVDGKLAQDYESRLTEALTSMREENDEQIKITREETEEIFERKLRELRDISERSDDAAEKATLELRILRKQVNDFQSRINQLESENSLYKSQIESLEGQLARMSTEHEAAINVRDQEIRKLRQALEDQLTEYRDLLDIKIQLDTEIAAYRRLLESEETRLNISSSFESTPSRSQRRGTPTRGTPVSARKRKRTDMTASTSSGFGGLSQISESSSKSGFSATSSASGTVEVYETDEEGKFIKLFNNGDKNQSLGGWQLQHVSGDQETSFKFHRSSKIGPGQYVTVWSSDSEATHSPPTDLVMKGQTWFIGDKMKTTLLNSSAEEMATREMSRSFLRTWREGSRDDGERAEGAAKKSWFPSIFSLLK